MNLKGSIQSEIVVKFFCFVFKVICTSNFFFFFLQKSPHVLQHLLKNVSILQKFGGIKISENSILLKASKVSGSD